MDYFLFLTRHTVNCRRQTEIKAKSTVQIPFFEKSAEMQLLNSNIPQRAQTTRYSNKKAQDLLNLVLFVFCSFFVLQRWRRRRDLNPRYGLSHTTPLAGEPLRPLGYFSKFVRSRFAILLSEQLSLSVFACLYYHIFSLRSTVFAFLAKFFSFNLLYYHFFRFGQQFSPFLRNFFHLISVCTLFILHTAIL